MRPSSLDLWVTQAQDSAAVPILHAAGNLDCFTYLDLIHKTQELYRAGHRDLLLDLQSVADIRLSGLFALYSASMMFQNEEPPTPEGGMAALAYMAHHVQDYRIRHFKLLSASSALKENLAQAGFEVYGDLPAALASFTN